VISNKYIISYQTMKMNSLRIKMNATINSYKNISSRSVQIICNLGGAYAASSILQTSSPPLRLAAAGMGAILANHIYSSYDFASLDDTIRDPISGLTKAASDIASGHGSIFDYGIVGGAGYAGYSASSYALGGSTAAVAAEGVESAGLLAELGAGALETIEMLAPLAILV
jgi:hypothetical protein